MSHTHGVLVSPLRILCAIANPLGLSPFDDASAWHGLLQALQPLTDRGRVIVERELHPSEVALRQLLSVRAFHIIHFVGHARSHAANYGTLALLASDGQARNISAQALADLIRASPSVRLLVLEACDRESFCFETIAGVAVRENLSVAITPVLDRNTRQTFLTKLYSGILNGFSAEALTSELRQIAPAETGQVNVVAADIRRPIITIVRDEFAGGATPTLEAPVLSSEAWRNKLERKRATGAFDVFLCHNSSDKLSVKKVAQRLKEAGILPWLDVWELPPGLPWQPLLEKQIGDIGSAAVFVGSAGFGPWQEQELYGFLREFVKRKVPVIPVMLPDAPARPELPIFLRGMLWVDFRAADPEPLAQLIWGITGRRPSD